MDRSPDAWIARRSLYKGRLFEIGHVVCRPTPEIRTEVEYAGLNVLALPVAGVFALHDGPRRHVIATPNHAVFISSGLSYRVSFPGSIGDECLTLRLSAEGLAKLMPEGMSREGFHASTIGTRAVLPPSAILARGLLWRQLAKGEADPLQVEELGIGLLDSVLRSVRESRAVSSQRTESKSRQVERVKEAISTSPERKWTLGELSGVAGVSPYHLAHVFSKEVGTSVYRYAVRLRLANALNAVLDSNLDLTSIALDAGFTSHSHFTARFRAFFGLTPDALRRAARSGKAADLRKIVTAHPAAAA
jgi:AraC family transcriptional regulator